MNEVRSAADAIASLVTDDELHEDYVIPSMFDRRVMETVAQAVRQAACETGVARGRCAEKPTAASAILANLRHLPAPAPQPVAAQ